MQSIAAIRSLRLISSTCTSRLLPLARASNTTARTADTAIHSEDPQGEDADEAAKASAAEQQHQQKPRDEHVDNKPHPTDKTPPFASSPKLESSGVGPTVDPIHQQKRWWSRASIHALDDVACVGFDGTPLHEQEKDDGDDYREYYEEHKPSPLSELEFADTRLPISRATDGEKRDDIWGGDGLGYVIEDTVDEALQRAEAMFWAAKERGDPDSPQARALARKLREYYQEMRE